MIKYILLSGLCILQLTVFAQKNKADSLQVLLAVEKKDSNKVTILWNMAVASYAYNPDTALSYAQRALFLARKIKYTEGESRSLGIIANSFLKIGNYPKALEFYLDKLKIEEKRDNPRNLASVIMNIGIVYVYQEEFRKALPYYYKADSIIRTKNVEDLKFNIAINLGDLYNRLHNNDSAFLYFQKSLSIAKAQNEEGLIGSSMVGMGHIYAAAGNLLLSKIYYHEAIRHLLMANDEDIACEAALGLAKVFRTEGQSDSAQYYAHYMQAIAYNDGFISWQLEAANFLTAHFKSINNSDSALKYLELSQVLQDSISSKEKIRESQILSSNEQLRQAELAESLRRAKEERSQQLQLLFIGIFIPGLFLFTLFLSRRKVRVKVIKAMGIISLLMLFEYLTLLLHPRVLELTNHTPVFEIMIFVLIAAILIPTHHRVEHWLIEKLTRKPSLHASDDIVLQTRKLVTKKPPSKL
jgi:tetratricopeptide (TPR) repeat protein